MRSADVLERPAMLPKKPDEVLARHLKRPYSLRVVRGKRAEAGAPFVVTEASQAWLTRPST